MPRPEAVKGFFCVNMRPSYHPTYDSSSLTTLTEILREYKLWLLCLGTVVKKVDVNASR
jgi:hypothetical protein